MKDLPESIDPKKSTILVVDDEKDIQNFLKFKLQKIGYDVIVAADGHEAIEKVKKIEPDLILLDLLMPKMDGYKTCKYLKEHEKFKHIPVIIVSAVGDIDGKVSAYKYGADDYLTKPIEIITLVVRVKSILETKRLREKLRREADKKAITDNLFDYQHLFERLETELEKCRKELKDIEIRDDKVQYKSPSISLIYLDIDYMKMINTEYGFKAGDFVIREVRDIVYRELEEDGMIFLSNSDKIFVILPNVDEGKSYMLAHQVLKEVDQIVLPFDVLEKKDNKIIGISVSMGLVTWNKIENISSDRLFYYAENALKNAKNEGRGKNIQYQFYSKPLKDGSHVVDKKITILSGGQDEK